MHTKEKEIDAQKEAIRAKKEEEAQAILNARVQTLAQYGVSHDLFVLKNMEQGAFDALVLTSKEAFEIAEKVRIEKEEADRLAREDLVRREAIMREKEAEQARIAQEQKAAQDKIDTENSRVQREAEIAKARKEAEEKARIDTELRIKREAELKAQQEAEETAKLEKKKKYSAFLEANGYTEESKDEFKSEWEGKTCTLWKKVATITL